MEEVNGDVSNRVCNFNVWIEEIKRFNEIWKELKKKEIEMDGEMI